MPSVNTPPDTRSILKTSAPDNFSTNPPRHELAPHRKHAKKFLTLPDELLTNISDNVAPEDLPNFRLTCKTLANIAAKHFGERRLAHRRFILTEYSLKGLVGMTAHPVFGPCIKSIMFGTDRTTNQLEVLMSTLESRNITDHTDMMRVLQLYRERWNQRSAFLTSQDLSRLLVAALMNFTLHGTSVSLGIFNDMRSGRRDEEIIPGYGSFREYSGLPFCRFETHNERTLESIRSACRTTTFRPKLFEFDLRGQGDRNGKKTALSRLLLTDSGLLPDIDVCIRKGPVDVFILSSLSRLEFKQRSEGSQMSVPENIRFTLTSLGRRMNDALFPIPLTHLRMESCSMRSFDFINILERLAGTLQTIELVDVAFWCDTCTVINMGPILHSFKHDLRLRTLVLDGLRAMHKNSSYDTGILLAKGRFWHGQQQIHGKLDIISRSDGYGWDTDDYTDWFESDIRSYEHEIQSMEYPDFGYHKDYTEYIEYRAQQEEALETCKRLYEEYKVARADVKEAMARVESGEHKT
jgi:hypothetical protein